MVAAAVYGDARSSFDYARSFVILCDVRYDVTVNEKREKCTYYEVRVTICIIIFFKRVKTSLRNTRYKCNQQRPFTQTREGTLTSTIKLLPFLLLLLTLSTILE